MITWFIYLILVSFFSFCYWFMHWFIKLFLFFMKLFYEYREKWNICLLLEYLKGVTMSSSLAGDCKMPSWWENRELNTVFAAITCFFMLQDRYDTWKTTTFTQKEYDPIKQYKPLQLKVNGRIKTIQPLKKDGGIKTIQPLLKKWDMLEFLHKILRIKLNVVYGHVLLHVLFETLFIFSSAKDNLPPNTETISWSKVLPGFSQVVGKLLGASTWFSCWEVL